MARSTKRSGKRWTGRERRALRALARQNTPTGVIGLKLGRTKAAVRTQASGMRVSLKPVNQSPYTRRASR